MSRDHFEQLCSESLDGKLVNVRIQYNNFKIVFDTIQEGEGDSLKLTKTKRN